MPRPFSLKPFLCLYLFAFVASLRAQTPTKPQYGGWGFDLAGADTKTKPGDDFFRYANGTWIDKTQIPPNKPAYSLRLAMTDLTEQRLHEIMETLAAKDLSKDAFYLRQAGLGLRDRGYYLKPEFEKQKSAYQTYVTTLLKLVAWPEAEARARDVVHFETKIADASWTKAEQRNLDAIYNPMTVDELAKFTPGFNWKGFLDATRMDNL